MKRARTVPVLTTLCIAVVALGYFSFRYFVRTRSSSMAQSRQERLVFSHVQRTLDSVAEVVADNRFASWNDVFDHCSARLAIHGERDAPCPFPATRFAEKGRFGRTSVLPSGFLSSRTPLIWHLSEFPASFTPDEAKHQVAGKTMVVFWNGDVRFMSLNEVSNVLLQLKVEHPTSEIVIMDTWDGSEKGIWRKL